MTLPPPTALIFWPLHQYSQCQSRYVFGCGGFCLIFCLHAALGSIGMALNIPGVVMMVVFYILILGTGLWGARKSRSAERSSSGDRTAVVLLGDRRISLLVGIFTMTGMWCALVALKQSCFCKLELHWQRGKSTYPAKTGKQILFTTIFICLICVQQNGTQ